MGTTAPSIYIEAPVERVFAFWANPANLKKLTRALPYFNEVIEVVELTSDGVGTTYRTLIKVKGVWVASITDTYVEVVPQAADRRQANRPQSHDRCFFRP